MEHLDAILPPLEVTKEHNEDKGMLGEDDWCNTIHHLEGEV